MQVRAGGPVGVGSRRRVCPFRAAPVERGSPAGGRGLRKLRGPRPRPPRWLGARRGARRSVRHRGSRPSAGRRMPEGETGLPSASGSARSLMEAPFPTALATDRAPARGARRRGPPCHATRRTGARFAPFRSGKPRSARHSPETRRGAHRRGRDREGVVVDAHEAGFRGRGRQRSEPVDSAAIGLEAHPRGANTSRPVGPDLSLWQSAVARGMRRSSGPASAASAPEPLCWRSAAALVPPVRVHSPAGLRRSLASERRLLRAERRTTACATPAAQADPCPPSLFSGSMARQGMAPRPASRSRPSLAPSFPAKRRPRPVADRRRGGSRATPIPSLEQGRRRHRAGRDHRRRLYLRRLDGISWIVPTAISAPPATDYPGGPFVTAVASRRWLAGSACPIAACTLGSGLGDSAAMTARWNSPFPVVAVALPWCRPRAADASPGGGRVRPPASGPGQRRYGS